MPGYRGTRSSRVPTWRSFAPQLDCWNNYFGFGAGTPPVLGAGSVQKGRYLYLPDLHLCHYEFDIRFGSSGNAAGGGTQNALAGNYLVELPVPCRDFDSPQLIAQAGDRPLGSGLILRGVGGVPQYPQVPCIFTNADIPAAANGGPANRWAQMFVPYAVDSGTSSIGAAATSQAVSFAYTLNTAPSAAEIVVVFTNEPTTPTVPTITAVSTTGFTVSSKSAPGTAFNFSWVLTAYKSTLVNAQAPFNLGAVAGDAIRGSLTYETAT